MESFRKIRRKFATNKKKNSQIVSINNNSTAQPPDNSEDNSSRRQKPDITPSEREKRLKGKPNDQKIAKASTPKESRVSPETEKAISEFMKPLDGIEYAKLMKEYEDLPKFAEDETPTAKPPEGAKKYQAHPVIQKTRIVLEKSTPTASDFVNANKVQVKNSERICVLMAAPNDETVEDFWKAVFQENCAYTVVLSNFHENGVAISPAYWPLEAGNFHTHGCMWVNTKKVETKQAYTEYMIEVLPEGCSNSLITRLAHCTIWPPETVPSSNRVILRILKWMHLLEKEAASPFAVVCSDGAMRSGTFTAIEIISQLLLKGHATTVKDVVSEMRQQRALVVGTDVQYFCIYLNVMDYIKAKGIKKYDNQISRFYEMLNKRDA